MFGAKELAFAMHGVVSTLTKRPDTVGELGRVENCASRMASLKAQGHGNAYAERLAWEGGNRFANSIQPLHETLKKYCQRRLKARVDVSSSRLNKHRLINPFAAYINDTCPGRIDAQAAFLPKFLQCYRKAVL
jgi:hypothetical protein